MGTYPETLKPGFLVGHDYSDNRGQNAKFVDIVQVHLLKTAFSWNMDFNGFSGSSKG